MFSFRCKVKCKILTIIVLILIIYSMSQDATQKSSCIFCNIANHLENNIILYEDEDVCVFNDIKPASDFHVLVIPKRHIEDAKALVSSDKELVEKIIQIGKDQLQKNNFTVSEARLGFHWPPFRSVKHLHLHVIAPERNMGWMNRLIFLRDSYWFVSPEYVLSRL